MSATPVADAIRLRHAERTDLERLAALCRAELPSWDLPSLEAELARECAILSVAELDDTVVAFALAWCLPPDCELLAVVVEDRHRRRGVARRLLEQLDTTAGQRGARTLHLEVASRNAAARALYAAAGFRENGIRPGYYRTTGDDAVLMVKDL